MPVQNTLILFAVDPAGDDDLHAIFFCGLDNCVGVIRFVRQKCLGLQPIEQLGHRLGVVPLAPGSRGKVWFLEVGWAWQFFVDIRIRKSQSVLLEFAGNPDKLL